MSFEVDSIERTQPITHQAGTTISLNGVGKAFRVYASQWDRLKEWLLPVSRRRHVQTWVLREITADFRQGEAVGIVGVNGAGKSTLLKIISGITQPSAGTMHVAGRLSALLELGMGFHPDFTGRQNVLTAGQLMGIPLHRLHALMPDIEAFAEIGEYMDRPVRVYSSGMQMRLAFSLATAERPEVLIVDEALSVGDAYFQHKSFDRIRQFKAQGTTLILVSHDRFAVQSICDRAILLQDGTIVRDGDPESVLDYYNASLSNTEKITQRLQDGRTATVSGDGAASVSDLCLTRGDDQDVDVLCTGDIATLTLTIQAQEDLDKLVCGYAIRNRLGQDMYGINTFHTGHPIGPVSAGERVRVSFRFAMNLGAGEYSIATALAGGETHLEGNYEWCDLAKVFTIINAHHKAFSGCAWLEPEVEIEALS
ncbi:MAG: ABC transporter ATP-binding protein [Luminiphilus sp.]|nr:ABC transporter ATP-binding protein [Luminiphilus sp.]